jgi:hypothetical protein
MTSSTVSTVRVATAKEVLTFVQDSKTFSWLATHPSTTWVRRAMPQNPQPMRVVAQVLRSARQQPVPQVLKEENGQGCSK